MIFLLFWGGYLVCAVLFEDDPSPSKSRAFRAKNSRRNDECFMGKAHEHHRSILRYMRAPGDQLF